MFVASRLAVDSSGDDGLLSLDSNPPSQRLLARRPNAERALCLQYKRPENAIAPRRRSGGIFTGLGRRSSR